jgi:cytochrome c553
MKRRAGALSSCCLCVLVALGCEPRDPTPAGRGARIFQRTCAACHGADGRGSWRAALIKPPRDLTNVEFQVQMSNEQLRHSIRVGRGQMPAFGGLMSDDEIADVIAFVRTLVPPGSLPPSVVAEPPAGAAAGAGGQAAPSAAPVVSPPTAQGSP